MAMGFTKGLAGLSNSWYHHIIRPVGTSGKVPSESIGVNVRRHLTAGTVTLFLVLTGILIRYWQQQTPFDTKSTFIEIHDEVISGVLHERLTISYNLNPEDICDASMHIALYDGVESTKVYSAGLFTDLTFTNSTRAQKSVILPVVTPPGKVRLNVIGEFRCNAIERLVPYKDTLVTTIIKVADQKRFDNNPIVRSLNRKVISLTEYVKRLERRLQTVERRVQ